MKLSGTFSASELPHPPNVRSLQNERPSVSRETMDGIVALLGPQPAVAPSRWFSQPQRTYRDRVYKYDLSDPLIHKVFLLIYQREGLLPKPWQLLLTPCSNQYFFEYLLREYTEADLDRAPYLGLFSRQWIAKMAPREDFGPLQVLGNKMLENPRAFGRLDPYVVRGMNSWLVTELQGRDLKGFTVREIEILKRKPSHQPIWEPWSTVVMPRCCLPLVTDWGQLYTPDSDRPRGCHYEGGPFMPEEKVFLKSEVEALGEFDIAVCQELVGMGNNDRYPPLVVSQKFRTAMKELKVSGVAYAPVRLVEEGEPLWKNPWEEIVGPYPEAVPVAGQIASPIVFDIVQGHLKP